MKALTLTLAALLAMSIGSAASAAVVVHAGPVHVGIGRRPAVRPAARPAVRHAVRTRRATIRNNVHDNRVDAWNGLLDAIQQ